jgi:hypothetical protein
VQHQRVQRRAPFRDDQQAMRRAPRGERLLDGPATCDELFVVPEDALSRLPGRVGERLFLVRGEVVIGEGVGSEIVVIRDGIAAGRWTVGCVGGPDGRVVLAAGVREARGPGRCRVERLELGRLVGDVLGDLVGPLLARRARVGDLRFGP